MDAANKQSDNFANVTSDIPTNNPYENHPTSNDDLAFNAAAYLEAQRKKNEKYIFNQTPNGSWLAKETDNELNRIEIELSLDGSFVVCLIKLNVIPSEDRIIQLRTYQMIYNRVNEILGFIPAQVGEPIAFGFRQIAEENFDLNMFIDYGVNKLTAHIQDLKAINSGVPAEEIYKRDLQKTISAINKERKRHFIKHLKEMLNRD